MNFEIKGTPLPVVICSLEEGEALKTERGAMSWMSDNIKMETNAGGGIGKMFSRAISGESIFQNVYTSVGASGRIAFSSSFPGEILSVKITPDKPLVAQKSAFLASELGVNIDVFFQKKISAAFFGGEGFIMQKFSGNGYTFIEIDGSVVEYDLAAGETMIVDTGYLAAMDATVSIEVVTVKGVGNMLFGGEGVFNTKVTGPGHIWLQTMPINSVAGTIAPYIVTK